METLFIFCLSLVVYMFVAYPLILAVVEKTVGLFRRTQHTSEQDQTETDPPLSIIIAAHNEEHNIERRLENLFAQIYELPKLQIIIGSDGSTDSTLSKLESYSERAAALGIDLEILSFAERGGKPRILNAAVQRCKHELILFADARQTFSDNALRNLVRRFKDPKVGAVSGELFLREPTDQDSVADMGLYWRYEKQIRKLEARLHSTVGATGAIYVIRKSLYQEIPERTLIDDVVIPMQICMQGYRVLFADDAHAYDVAPTDSNREWVRKVRTLAGNWQLISIRPQFLNPFRNPIWMQFMSHKMLRLTLPFSMAGMLYANLHLAGDLYSFTLVAQLLAYAIGVASFFSERLRQLRIPGLIYFFCLLNAAILMGFYRLASGKKEGLWSFAYKSSG